MTWDQYTKMATNKTAPFIALPMMGMFNCNECSKAECEGLQESSDILGLSYQWLNDLENLIGVDQDKFTDIYNNHPNGMLINIIQNIDESEKIEIIKDPSTLKDYLDEISFKNQKNMIKNLIHVFENYIDPNDPTNNCLDVAIITAPEKRTKKTKDKLKTIAGRVLNK